MTVAPPDRPVPTGDKGRHPTNGTRVSEGWVSRDLVYNLVKPLQTEAIIGEMFLRQTWTRELTTERDSLLTDVTGHAPRASRLSLILPDATYHTTSVNRD